MNVKGILIVISILCCSASIAQVQDSFADGDLDQNPTWIGDSSHFTVTPNKELQLDAPAQDASSYLVVPSQAIGNASWRFYLRLDFNPSSSNYLDVHVNASSKKLDSSNLSSYFIRIGDTEDEVALYKETPSMKQELIDGPNGITDRDPVELDIRLTRKGTGQFTLAVDSTGGSGNYDTIGTAYDNQFQTSSYFGFECRYTSTRADRFYFDDILVKGSPYQDTIPPEPDTLSVPKKGELELLYDEPIDSTSFQTKSFELRPLSLRPDSMKMAKGGRRIELYFPKGIPNDSLLTLYIPALKDTAGNLSQETEREFRYLVPDPPTKGAVLINELMVDPSPAVGLPEREYLELHTVDTLIQDLGPWELTIGGTSLDLPERILRPGERLLLIAASDSSLFDPPQAPILLDPFPALTNGGATVLLEDGSGRLIDSVSYTDDWYGSTEKDDGGWSLERIDPGAECSKAPNWKASVSEEGGTPGKRNSVNEQAFDTEPPEIEKARTLNEKEVLLSFDERIDEGLKKGEVNIVAGPRIDSVIKTDEPREWILRTNAALDSGNRYEAEMEPPPDCFGNRASGLLKDSIILPYRARKKDVLINELLFDPEAGGKDMVELYNSSEKILDMSDWELAHYEDSISGKERIGGEQELLPPKGYRFLSEDPHIVVQRFPGAPVERGIRMEDLPSYPNDSGTVILTDGQGKVLDRFSYRSTMHHPLLQNKEGVTLERIDPDLPSSKTDNWHSAASSADYGTPGERNSQARERSRNKKNKRIWSEPKVFSPDMDGDRDRLRIHYRFEERGMNCSIEIYDARGQKVETLVNGEMLERRGSLVWDGTDTNGKKVPIGVYIIVLEGIHPSGDRIQEKTTCVVGTRWD